MGGRQMPQALVSEADAQFIKQRVSQRLAEERKTNPGMTRADREQRCLGWINDEVATWYGREAAKRGAPPSGEEETALARYVFDLLFRAGRLQPLLDDTRFENIHINRYDQVWGDLGNGELVRLPPVASSDAALREMLQELARNTSHGQQEKTFSPEAKPELALRLDDGSRVQAFTGVTPYTCVNIRKHRHRDVTLDDLVELGTLDTSLRDFLRAAIHAEKNLMISGKAGSGKTTLLRALMREYDPDERIATLETEYELFAHENEHARQIVALEGREATGESTADGRAAGQYTLQDLIAPSLRMGTQRTVVGEVRGAEIIAMMQALTSGEGGSLSTIHCRSAYGVFDRIAELYALARENLSEKLAYRQIRNGLDFIVHVELINERRSGGGRHRFVSHVLEITGGENQDGKPATNTVFGPRPEAGEVRAVPLVAPACLLDLLRAGMPEGALDRATWSRPLPLKWGGAR
ncbi:CpaF/VirB11 family protein [Streptomyces sp. 891-h]|uniref:CpaF family protein n=1 Tax=Streptomyces sp. 891-h TaxID=2720714 RepID=UPI001FA994E1|nr:CpaF/VirB11 family protein [Streptomyces sp. 891-h]UNZ21394.1 CpaF family protein [Streptomyces sp. 891-h]